MAFAMDDYVQVNERIAAFYEAHPTGSIQSEIHTLTENLVVVKASAWRGPDDTRPCIAHSQLAIPGKTSFTRDSEVENAETSAVGRALAMMGFEVKRSLASREEARNKHDDSPAPKKADKGEETQAPAAPEWAAVLTGILNDEGMKAADLAGALGVQRVTYKVIGEYIDKSGVHPRIALEQLVTAAKEQAA